MTRKVLLALVLLYATGASAKELLEIEITSGTRAQQTSIDVPAFITVITRDDIQSSQASSISDVLRGKTGFQVTDLRGDGADTNVSLRGFSQTANANVLILVDGRRLNYADTRNPDLSHLSLYDIERIEVIQGSAGVLYGNQAVGGVINIITRRAQAGLLDASVGLGSYGREQLNLQAGDRHANGISWRVALDTLDTDGYRDHSARSFASINSLLDYDYGDGHVFAEYQAVSDDLELPGALLEAAYDQDRRQINQGFANDFSNSDVSAMRTGIRHHLSDHWRIEAELTSRDTDQDLTQSFQNLPSPSGGYSRRTAASVNPRLIGSYAVNDSNMLWTLGADIESNNYRLFIPNAFGATNQSNDQETQAWYAQLVYPLSADLSATVGARTAEVDNDLWDARAFPVGQQADDRVSVGTLGLNYQYSGNLRLYARLDENFRFAKVNEITGAGGAILDTQTGQSYEAGFEWRQDSAFIGFNLYQLDLKDEIYFDPTVGVFGVNVNLDETRRRGLILDAGIDLDKNLSVSANYSYTHAKFAGGGLDGNYISGVAPHLATLRMNYSLRDHWQVTGEYQLISDKYAIGDNLNRQRKASGYGLLNMGMKYENNNWAIKLQGNNLLDKEYAEFISDSGFGRGYQSSPERNILATVSYQFE